jgi:hypothetical protein
MLREIGRFVEYGDKLRYGFRQIRMDSIKIDENGWPRPMKQIWMHKSISAKHCEGMRDV